MATRIAPQERSTLQRATDSLSRLIRFNAQPINSEKALRVVQACSAAGLNFFKHFPELVFQDVTERVEAIELKEENLVTRRADIAEIAEKVLHSFLFDANVSPYKIEEEYTDILQSIIDLYLLAVPIRNPDSHKVIRRMEMRTELKHLTRTKGLWSSMFDKKSSFHSAYYPHDHKLNAEEIKEADRWLDLDGLVYHTLIAASFIRFFTQKLQTVVYQRHQLGFPLNDVEKKLLERKLVGPDGTKRILDPMDFISDGGLMINPTLLGIQMAFHDLGRLVTNDPVLHEHEGMKILTQAKVAPEYWVEPTMINCFLEEFPLESIFSYATKESPAECPDENGNIQHFAYSNLEALLFWVADYYGKPMIVTNERGEKEVKLRKPEDVLTVVEGQRKHYGTIQNNGKRSNYYAFELDTMQRMLMLLEDKDKGFRLPHQNVKKIFEIIEDDLEHLFGLIHLTD